MDIDAFVAVNAARWDRLDTLVRARRRTGAEADELVQLYQLTATHLSKVRTSAPDPTVVTRLSGLLARARGVIAGAHEPAWSDVTRFVVISLPAAFYRARWLTLAALAFFCIVGVATGMRAVGDPELLAQMGTPSEREQYANELFEAYYSNSPAPDFAAQVWTNNAWIAAQCIAGGITGIFPVYVLVQNAVGVGMAGAVMAEHGQLDLFFALILPHGLMELSAIFIAAGAGLRLFFAWAFAGPRTRSRALAEEGRAVFTVAIGLVVVLGVSGLVEGFVTPSDLPTGVKITIGAMVLAAYWIYTIVLGRHAVRDGETGDVRAEHAEDTVAMAA
ncbi:stage II sporulation protein M [Ruania alba]|uniref:stage II sporulation protein M n=1 Tax=Ruania alba TaxID=648782 RepID=UPI000B7D6866|nr:stage II sporulation protein M [Ruania alba]